MPTPPHSSLPFRFVPMYAARIRQPYTRFDGDTPTPDWMGDSAEKDAMAEEVWFLIRLLE